MKQKFKSLTFSLPSLCFLILLIILADIYFAPIQKTSSTAQPNLSSLSAQEKEYLTNFFKVGFFMSGVGYTIFGDKPMSFETINIVRESKNVEGIDYMDINYIFSLYRLREGWEVWQKHSSRYPLKGFSIIYYPSLHAPTEFIDVAIISHQNFIRIVNEHLSDFQSIVGEYSAQQILEGYLKAEGNFFYSIRSHEGLFGTLLGFGRDNAWEYMKRSGGESLESFIEEGDVLSTQHILPPLFSVIADSDETHKLREKYQRQRKSIDLIYQNEDFLNLVLRRLMSGDNSVLISRGRGRNVGYPTPPAQIRTCNISAYGSSFR